MSISPGVFMIWKFFFASFGMIEQLQIWPILTEFSG